MRVLHCISHFDLGGAEQAAFSIIEALHGKTDFSIFTVGSGTGDAFGSRARRRMADLGVPVFEGTRLGLKVGGFLWAAWALVRTVRAANPTVIHLHTEIPELTYALACRLSPSLRRIRVVRSIHNAEIWRAWKWAGAFVDRALANAAVVPVSADAAQEFSRYRQRTGVRGRAVSPVIFHGVPVSLRERSFRDLSSEYPLRLIFAGRFEHQKGADLLSEAMRLAANRLKRPVSLDIYGKGSMSAQLHAFAESPPAGMKVRMHGVVANLPNLMREYDCVLMPSRYEGLGLVAVEAILAGAMVVTTDATGLQDALPKTFPWRALHGDAPDFARVFVEAVERIGEWDAILAETQSFCRERFSMETMAAGYLAHYQGSPT